MDIRPFGVEMWMNEFETKCDLNLAETCVESITLGELFEMAGQFDVARTTSATVDSASKAGMIAFSSIAVRSYGNARAPSSSKICSSSVRSW